MEKKIEVLGTFKTVEEKKTFCPNGKVNPLHHFYVDPSKWNELNLIPQLKIGNYPLLVAPSQSGKTTRVMKLIEQLQSKYLPIYISTASMVADITTLESFWRVIVDTFSQKIEEFIGIPLPELEYEPSALNKLFGQKFKEQYYGGKSCILILDELDALEVLGREMELNKEESEEDKQNREMKIQRDKFLTKLREFKQESNTVLVSVLGITNWVGSYIQDTLGASPFNISNKITAPYFTKEEVYDLFGQYQKQEEIHMEDGIIDHIFEQTEGAQGLTVLFGKCFESRRQGYHHNPTLTEWKNFTYGTQLFSYARNESTNLSKMLRLVTESKEAERCRAALLSFLTGIDIQFALSKEMDLLQRANIIKYSDGKLHIASPFVKKLLLYSMRSEMISPLQSLPFKKATEIVDIPFLVEKVIENINIYQLMTEEKMSQNNFKSTEPHGCKEIVYVEEFHRTLKILLSNFPSVIYGREKSISEKSFHDFKSKYIKRLPQKAISCDTILDFGEFGLYALEHGANLSLSRDSSEDTTSTLWHHVYKQGELYHFGLNAKETWVIDWVTVDKDHRDVKYWYPKSDTVQTMYIYHSQDFSTFKIYTNDAPKPRVVTKVDAIDFSKLILTPSKERTEGELVKKRKQEEIPRIQGNLEEKIVYVKIGKDGKLRDLPALKEQTFEELKKLIQDEYPENERIRNGKFEVFDEEGLPVSKDTSVGGLKQKSKLQVELTSGK